jgi:hypothetical protein
MKLLLITTFFCCLLIFGIQFYLYFKIRKNQSEFGLQLLLVKLLPLFLVGLGVIFHFLPHFNLPLVGGVSIFEIGQHVELNLDDSFGYKLFSIWATFGLMLSSMFFHVVFKVGVKSKLIFVIDIVIGLYSSILGILIITQLNSLIDEIKESFLGDLFNLSLAYGLYGIASIGFLFVIAIFFQKKLSIAKRIIPIDAAKLRELKQLLDEGVLTKEEFDMQKEKFLN